VRLWDAATGDLVRQIAAEGDQMYALAFSPDSAVLVAAGHKAVRAFNAASGAKINTLGDWKDSHRGLAFSPTGKHLASGGTDFVVRIGTMQGDPTGVRKHRSHVLAVAFRPDGKVLASAGKDNIRLWDVETVAEMRTLEGHKAGVTSLAFSPDGKTLASGSEDKTVRLWPLK
jgi:WD40 repeat protein